MSDNDHTPDARVYNFPQIGFRLSPTLTAPPEPGTAIPPMPDTPPTVPAPRSGGRRRSPLDTLAALPDPGLTTPLLPAPTDPTAPPGHLPDTFRGDDTPDGYTGGRLGALSLAACLAVAVAALRGTHTFLTDRRQRRLVAEAENAQLREARLKRQIASEEARGKHVLAMQGLRDKRAQQRTKQRVQSGPEFGRKSLGRSGSGSGLKSSGGSAGGRGGGAGRGGGSGTSTGGKKKASGGSLFGGKGSGSSRTNGAGPKGKDRKSLLDGGGARKKTNGAGGSGSGGGRGTKKDGLGSGLKNGLRRNSQGGSKTGLDKQRRKQLDAGNGDARGRGKGTGGTGLGAALKKDTQKAAARRWKKRQKHGAATPALWGASTPKKPNNQKNAPKNPATGPGDPGNKPGQGPVNLNKPKTRTKVRKPQAQGQGQASGSNRRNLNQALWHDWKKAADRRWKKRQRAAGPVPPLWKNNRHTTNQRAANAGATAPKANLNKPKNAGATPRSGAATGGQAGRQKQRRQKNHTQWGRAWARKKTAGPTGSQPPPDGWASRDDYNEFLRAQHKQRMGYNRGRKSPFENAGHAAAQAAGTTYTVTSDHVPGSRAKRWQPDALTKGTPALPATGPAALDSAPTKTFPRPGATRPKEDRPMPPAPAQPDRRIVKARHQAARTGHDVLTDARHMDAQHATEITLEDAIDEYGDFKDDAFKTHDQCHKLADRAIKLRSILLDFAEELAVKHNLIGPMFSLAMARMAESMDLVARMAEEMKTSSLHAAEMAEAADNDLNDAYRPYNMATADAGLSTPSAPIHNET